MNDIDPTLLFPLGKKPKQDRLLKGKYKMSWVENVYANQSHDVESSVAHVGNHFTYKKSIIFVLTIVGIFVLIFLRLLQLQVLEGSALYARAEGNRQRIRPIPSERGLIFDSEGRQLVKNIPNFSLALVPQDLPRDEETLNALVSELAFLTKQSEEDVYTTIQKYGTYRFESVVIKEDIDYETALAIYIATADLPGVYIQQGSKRLYFHTLASSEARNTSSTEFASEEPMQSLSHVLGYLGKLNPDELESLYDVGYLPSDNIGKSGIEKTYEQQLRGQYGKRNIEVNARGILQKILAEERSYPGTHVTLSIDLAAQEQLERIMLQKLEQHGKSKASAVAMNPKTGAIVAMVSLPAFDNNDFSGGIDVDTYTTYLENEDNPLFNRAIAGSYPSGSTIKPLVGAAALQEGIIRPLTSILSTGGIRVAPWFFPDWQAGGHGRTNVRRSLAWSVNTFYYYIGGGYKEFKGMGLEKLVEYFKAFKLGSTLGIDLPGETAGFVPTRDWKNRTLQEPWYIGDTYNLSIGQGHLLVTPLQIASLTAAVANGGTIPSPHLVAKITDPQSEQEDVLEYNPIKEGVIDSIHIAVVARGMRDCVEYGSCRQLASLPADIAGKTGTAQWHSEKDDHAWFTSFAPFNNPDIVLTVMVEEGEGGSKIGVPIAYDFYAWWWKYKNS